MLRIRLLIFILLICASPTNAFAKYAQVDVEQVPIERLVANVQKKIEVEPNKVQWRYSLARLYSMAYAKGTQTWATLSDSSVRYYGDPGLPWFGYNDDALPHYWTDQERNLSLHDKPEFQNYLNQAIENYLIALKLDPSHLYSRLGLAWCLQEKGKTEEAIAAYRQVYQQAWEKEEAVDHGMGGGSICIEAGTMLAELLPKEGAEKERAEIQGRIEILGEKFRVISPLIIPLEEAGLEKLVASDFSKPVAFDLDGMGAAEWHWLTPLAGLLVWDPKETGAITSGRQLFGNVTWWIFWADGYQPLSLLDDNNDGKLSGTELRGLSLWQDINSDGISQKGEVRPLKEWRIICLACQPTGQQDGSLFHPNGVGFSNGKNRPSYDWISKKQARQPLQTASRLPQSDHPVLNRQPSDAVPAAPFAQQ